VELPAEMAAELLKTRPSAATGAPTDIPPIYDPQEFQALLRDLNQKKGVDLMSAPTVTTRAGQKCVINVIREFHYPARFEQASEGTVIPVAFETRNLGVTLEAEPTILPSGEIDLELAPEVTDFEGFVNFGGSRVAKKDLEGDPLKDTFEPTATHVINQPIFATRRVHTSITVRDGETIALGGLTRDDVQMVTEDGKRMPDIHVQRALYIFVTAKRIERDGPPPRSIAPSTPRPAAPKPAKGNQFYGVAVPGKPGFVTSPYAPRAGYVDVRGFPVNTEVKDPYTGRMFLVPPPGGAIITPTTEPPRAR
jgi:general secretion pathway protein D